MSGKNQILEEFLGDERADALRELLDANRVKSTWRRNLKMGDWNMAEVARVLGCSRERIRQLVRHYGLKDAR